MVPIKSAAEKILFENHTIAFHRQTQKLETPCTA